MFKQKSDYDIDINYQYQSLFEMKTDRDVDTVRGTYAL
jgi:hypothetical protein